MGWAPSLLARERFRLGLDDEEETGELVGAFQIGQRVSKEAFHWIGDHECIFATFEQRDEMARSAEASQSHACYGRQGDRGWIAFQEFCRVAVAAESTG